MTVTLLSAVEQLALLRQKKISPLELVEEHITRIAKLDPVLNAFADFDADRVRKQARAVKQGVLSGLPVTIKASIETAGHRCEIGSVLLRGQVPKQSAVVVDRLCEAGAMVLGTTNCPELLMAYETDNLLYGRTNNPWDTSRTPGGSSGGEAAAIAAGLSAAGLGSDSGGSVREPAHFSGICALKPTPGRIPSAGHLPPCTGPFSSLGAIGPMARTIADVQLLFDVLAGQDPCDPTGAPVARKSVPWEEARELSIGWLEEDGLVPVTAETRQAVRDAATALERRGFRVKPFRPSVLEAARRLWDIFFIQCGAMFYGPLIAGRENELSPVFQDFLAIAGSRPPLSAGSLLQAWSECDGVRRRFLEEMRECPLLLLPVCSIPAFRHGERQWTVEGKPLAYLDAMRFTQWFNLLASPAAVVPVGQSPEGLPIGVQIAGRPYEDERVLAVAAVLDSEFGYRPPPLG